jgi:hypothetical protein
MELSFIDLIVIVLNYLRYVYFCILDILMYRIWYLLIIDGITNMSFVRLISVAIPIVLSIVKLVDVLI